MTGSCVHLDPYSHSLTIVIDGVAHEVSYRKAIGTPRLANALDNDTLSTICKALASNSRKNSPGSPPSKST